MKKTKIRAKKEKGKTASGAPDKRSRRSEQSQLQILAAAENEFADKGLAGARVDEIAEQYPNVQTARVYVDAASLYLVQRPQTFDVIVTENMFGDILSDEASVLAGSLGMLPSASLGETRTTHGILGLYEPIHGSAPDIAGRGIANPAATILSAAMMLRWSFGRDDLASAMEAALRRTLADGIRTGDLMGAGGEGHTRVGTDGFRDAVLERLGTAVPA